MVNFTILAGGSGAFIASYLFNSDANTLSLIGQSQTGTNPTWIDVHPTNKTILYAVNEDTVGAVQSFIIKPDGLLTPPVGQTSSGGNGPAFTVPLADGQVAAMNFGSGNGLIIPTEEDPAVFTEGVAQLITFPAAKSNPHQAVAFGDEVLVPDLGADTIWRLSQAGAPGTFNITGQIDQPQGSGPRHIVTRNDSVFTVHELDSTLTQQQIPADKTTKSSPPLLANFTVIPPDLPAGVTMFAAEIVLAEASNATTPGGFAASAPFLYVSNRNTAATKDPRGDAIAIFALEPELALVGHVFTGLDQIRGMVLSGPASNDEFVVAAGVGGDAGVVVLRRTDGGAGLEIVAQNREIATRTSFVWLDHVSPASTPTALKSGNGDGKNGAARTPREAGGAGRVGAGSAMAWVMVAVCSTVIARVL